MKIMFTMSIIILSITMFPMMQSPLSMGFWLMIMTMFLSFLLNFYISSWFSIMLFLIYIGGLLVMFTYFLAINPNKKLKTNNKFNMILFLMIILFLKMNNSQMLYMNSFTKEYISPIFNLMTYMYLPIILLIVLTLLMALITVVKITMHNEGTLRPFYKN